MDIKTENKLKTYWDETLTLDEKKKILSNFLFWGGLVNYKYVYIPEDLKKILLLKIEENDNIKP